MQRIHPARLKPVLDAILVEYELPVDGIHGVAHWARVLQNGIEVGEATHANLRVVSLFALFHDAKRINEHHDPDHGHRGAEFARRLCGVAFEASENEMNLLCRACEGHTHELTHPDVTIQTCWDADRLDLGRVGVKPHPSRLCTDFGKLEKTIQRADGPATFNVVPDFVATYWKIEVGLH